jgi:ribosome-binding protein aMBF1 (putative translation factor)
MADRPHPGSDEWARQLLAEHGYDLEQPPRPPGTTREQVVAAYSEQVARLRAERDAAVAELAETMAELRAALRMGPEQGRAEVVVVVRALAGRAGR